MVTDRAEPAGPSSSPPGPGGRGRLVEIAVPVYNEEHVLAHSVRRLHTYLEQTFPYRFRITIADNASTDGTWRVARDLEAELPAVARCGWSRKAAAARCGTCGAPATPTSSPTWTWTCPPTWTPSSRWWRR
ncbi:glycosyltransferase [Actinomadura keratinilytica]|uniref:glycosyltransferase n=1 Tax=Actinomadura keratinilytica TaxID=547461 RepID=UPI0036126672